MADISRAASFGKLSPLAYKAIEGATVFCKLRGNPVVELQHWLNQILNADDSDLHHIVRHCALDTAALLRELTQSLDRLPRGAAAIGDIASTASGNESAAPARTRHERSRSSESSTAPAPAIGTSAMPQIGQAPGASRMISANCPRSAKRCGACWTAA